MSRRKNNNPSLNSLRSGELWPERGVIFEPVPRSTDTSMAQDSVDVTNVAGGQHLLAQDDRAYVGGEQNLLPGCAAIYNIGLDFDTVVGQAGAGRDCQPRRGSELKRDLQDAQV